ncbi:MAG: PEP/pyruvate-binding domain-containing protein, partial [Candidatus Limnocylindria bacterium]
MVAFLGEAETSDADSVGSKAATLSRLALRYDVPPGFCLEAAVFDRLSGAVAGDERARSELRALVAVGLERLQARLGGGQVAVAVRSSAIGEDGSDASFAGQHDTVLGVHGVDAIADAVLRCWRSVSDERALAYRREKGIDGPPRIAVLVQEFVEADVAAIAFTSDPVSGDRERVVVNASWGLGETIASGTVTPDTFTLRKADLALLSTEVSDKRVMAHRRDGAVVVIPVPEERRTRAALDEEAVRSVARLALDLERETGGPVDVECAFVAGRLVLLQSRPITALVGEAEFAEFPVTWSDPADAELTWHRDEAHHGEHAPPLSVEYVVEGPSAGVRGRARILGQPTLVRYQAQNGWIYFGGRHLVGEDQLPRARAVAEARVRDLSRRLPDLWRDEYLPSVRAHYAWMRSLALETISGAGAAALWDELWRRVNDIWTTHMLVVIGAYSAVDELARAHTQLTGRPDAEALELVQGRAMTLQRMQAELHRLVEQLRPDERLAVAIEKGDVRSVEDVRALSGSAAAAPIEAFLADHGDVGQAFGDLRSPPWVDDQPLLFDELARRLRSTDGDPATRLAVLRRRADSIAAAARTLLADRPEDLARFEEALAVAQAAGPLTEEHNYWIDRFAQANVRRAVLAFGERLARASQLGDPA